MGYGYINLRYIYISLLELLKINKVGVGKKFDIINIITPLAKGQKSSC